jgi:hypothetical protein
MNTKRMGDRHVCQWVSPPTKFKLSHRFSWHMVCICATEGYFTFVLFNFLASTILSVRTDTSILMYDPEIMRSTNVWKICNTLEGELYAECKKQMTTKRSTITFSFVDTYWMKKFTWKQIISTTNIPTYSVQLTYFNMLTITNMATAKLWCYIWQI